MDYSEPLVHLKQHIKLLEDGLSQKKDTEELYEIMSLMAGNCRKLLDYIRRNEK